MGKNKGLRFAGALAITLALTLVYAGCKHDDDDDDVVNPDSGLGFDAISRLGYTGGSLIYNPEGAEGHLFKGVAVATRIKGVSLNTSASADKKFTDTSNAIGYIIVKDVNTNSISFSYTEYDSLHVAHSKGTFTVNLDDAIDITGDGIPDVTYSPPAYKRDGMEKAVWLTFISPMPNQNSNGSIAEYAVLPGRYARQAYPNGIMGITPDGRFVVSMYESSGARAAVQGVEYGDIVVDNQNGKYANIKSGSAFRQAAQRMGENPDLLDDVGNTSGLSGDPPAGSVDDLNSTAEVSNTSVQLGTGSAEVNNNTDYNFYAEQFNNYATPDLLLSKLPAEITDYAAGGNSIAKLNSVIGMQIDAVVDAVIADLKRLSVSSNIRIGRSARAVTVNQTGLDALIMASEQLKEDASSLTTPIERNAALRSFLSAAYPEYCPLPAAQSTQEMFPIVDVSYSDPDTDVMENMASKIAAAQIELNTIAARAANRQITYQEYLNRRDEIRTQFHNEFPVTVYQYKIAPGDMNLLRDNLQLTVSLFESASVNAEVALYGSFTNYWGKIEAGIGLATLFDAEMDGPKFVATTTASKDVEAGIRLTSSDQEKKKRLFKDIPIKKDVLAGPVLLTISLKLGAGLEFGGGATAPNVFMGYIGVAGGKGWVGANYGIEWKWSSYRVGWWNVPYCYPSAYFNPYARGEAITQSLSFCGLKNEDNKLPIQAVTIIKPLLSVDTSCLVYRTLSVGLPVELAAPMELEWYGDTALHANYKWDLAFSVKATAGIEVDFEVYRYKQNFLEWTIYEWTQPIIPSTKLF